MTDAGYHVEKLAPGTYDLGAFDCGDEAYNNWLERHALSAMSAGTSAVYVLVETLDGAARVVGYFAINPTQVVRDDLPGSMARGAPAAVPGWLLAKLALHRDLRGNKSEQWGSRLLIAALEVIVGVADAGGGKVIVVDADGPGLLPFYQDHDFKLAREQAEEASDLRLFMKVSTARKAIA